MKEVVFSLNKKIRKKELSSHQEAQISKEFKNITFTVVLVRPEHAANIGSIARIMENFNFEDLVIFNPKESVEKIKSYNAQGFAMHGKDILLDSKIIEIQDQDNHGSEFRNFLKNFEYIIATIPTTKQYKAKGLLRKIFPQHTLTAPVDLVRWYLKVLIDIDACPKYILETLKTENYKKDAKAHPDSKNESSTTEQIMKETKAQRELFEDEEDAKSSK